ncbi:MAG: FHA domain-containing protein, partial [Polyangiales bacterium]
MIVDVFVLAPDGTTRSQRLDSAGAILVGRSAQCTLPLEGDGISRQHARITLGDGAMRVEDISSNWTMAGETVLRKQFADVGYGTPLVIGTYTLQIFLAQNAPPLHTPPTVIVDDSPKPKPQATIKVAPPPPLATVREKPPVPAPAFALRVSVPPPP